MISYIVATFFLIFLGYLFYLLVNLIYEIINKEKAKYLKTGRLIFSYILTLIICYGSMGMLALAVIAPQEVYTTSKGINYPLINWLSKLIIKYLISATLTLCILFFLSYIYQSQVEKLKTLRPIFKTLLFCLTLTILASLLSVYSAYWNWVK